MKCKRCGQKIKRRNRNGRNKDPIQQCPKAVDFGFDAGTPCAPAQAPLPTPLPRYNPDVENLRRRRGPRKRYK